VPAAKTRERFDQGPRLLHLAERLATDNGDSISLEGLI
jgi:hypothetical protein